MKLSANGIQPLGQRNQLRDAYHSLKPDRLVCIIESLEIGRLELRNKGFGRWAHLREEGMGV